MSSPNAVRRFTAVWAISVGVKAVALAVLAYLLLYVLGVHA